MINYCTYFDSKYLVRGFALYQSLDRHTDGDGVCWVLCLDDRTHEILLELGLPAIRPVVLAELLGQDNELARLRESRAGAEWIWSLTASWLLYVMGRVADDDLVCYLDADMLFFSDPEPTKPGIL